MPFRPIFDKAVSCLTLRICTLLFFQGLFPLIGWPQSDLIARLGRVCVYTAIWAQRFPKKIVKNQFLWGMLFTWIPMKTQNDFDPIVLQLFKSQRANSIGYHHQNNDQIIISIFKSAWTTFLMGLKYRLEVLPPLTR